MDVDREKQTITGDTDTDSVVALLVELIGAFGEPMRQQLSDGPVIRYPLSTNPDAFLNRARQTHYTTIGVPGTDLYFCPHSQRTEKVEKLRRLFARLTLPDGDDFPPGSVEVSIESNQAG